MVDYTSKRDYPFWNELRLVDTLVGTVYITKGGFFMEKENRFLEKYNIETREKIVKLVLWTSADKLITNTDIKKIKIIQIV